MNWNLLKLNLSFFYLTTLTACSHGFLSVPPATISYFESQTGTAVRMESWGVAIDTNMDSDLSIGHIVKTYFYEAKFSNRLNNGINEKIKFLSDLEHDSNENNNVLIDYLSSGWNPYNIMKIDRINSNYDNHNSGWQVTFNKTILC